MAGKPERVPPGQPSPAPPSSQNQTPLQNVIVYVSENFPQTYMTQQNVECGEAYSNNINGAGYINGDQSSPSMNNSSQVMKHGKTQEYLSNGFLPVQNNGAYFQTNTNGEGTVVQNNNFNSCQMASNMMNSFSYTNDGGTVVNHGFEGIKCAPEISNHQIAMQQQSSACASNGTSSHMVMDNRESMGVYTIAQSSQNVPVSGMQTFVSNQMDLKQGLDNGSLDNYMTIIGDSNSNNLNVQRCDSVRSDAAESSCSSLSSADCQQESSNNSGAVLAHQNQVQGQVDLNQQHVFQSGHNMQRFMHQNAPQTPPMFSGSNQQVLVNSNMGQHVVQTGVNQPYIPPGEHHIQIVQGNLPADGSHPQFLQSGGSNRAVVGNNSVNCSTPQMTQGTHPQLVATSGSNQLQLFPQNVNQIQVVTSQVSGMQVSGGKQQAQQPHQQQPQQPHHQQQRQHLPLGPPLSQQPPASAAAA
ncbi:transcription factor mef2A-like, partial [Frankliniella occidentalis]|uniref:Transcription factor mef2A-like n=1 Tax=Frankliniella occidentalis TaxID=133901 RepID=A0A9C6XQE1_FRAOC